jgi:tetratricopeptide (TPR) repeat protein
MKLPAAYKSVTIDAHGFDTPYPPLGFYAIAEHQLGNGDIFGLYWPIGREDHDPIVAETYHDQWSVTPQFSSLERFLALAGDDDDAFVETPALSEDSQSPVACLNAARESLKLQNVDRGIDHLKAALSVLPEYTDAQSLLCAQYRRIDQRDAAIKSALLAIISPPSFGIVPSQLLAWLASQSTHDSEIQTDPIWINRKRLTLKFGGVKENDDYRILEDAINQYLDLSGFIPAMTLMQTYAELMYRETVSFRERNRFDVRDYLRWQREVAATRYGKSRSLVLPNSDS